MTRAFLLFLDIMKSKPKHFIIPLHIYPFDVMVSIGETDEQLFKRLWKFECISKEDLELCKMEPTNRGKCIALSGNHILIRLPHAPKTPEQFGTLAHEIFHAVTFLMYKIGAKFRIEVSDEPYAYLIGYLTQEIHKRL